MLSSDDPRQWCLVSPRSEDLIRSSDGSLVPSRFQARIDHPDADFIALLMIAVQPDGSAVCYSVGSYRREALALHEWVHDVLVSLPLMGLRQWVRYAVAIMAEQSRTGANPLMWPAMPDEATAEAKEWLGVANTFAAQKTTRRKATTPSRLADVATVYRAAVQEGRPPVMAVKDHQHVSRPQASKLVVQARREGYLGPSIGRKAGEG